jgi:S-DNA-T family DNA segregation ATPase FtsK/SpoIIIE
MDSSRIKEEIKGILAIVAGLIMLISLISHNSWDQSLFTKSGELNNLLGSFGAQLSELLLQFIGYASYIIPAILLIAGVKMVVGQSVHHKYIIFFGALVLLIIASSSIIQLMFGEHSGGLIGIKCTALTLAIVSTTGSYLIFATLTLISLMYLIHFSVMIFMGNVKTTVSLGSKAISAAKAKRKERKQRKIEDMTIPATIYEQEELPMADPEIKIKSVVKRAAKLGKKRKASDGEYELPGLELLNNPPPSITKPSKEELIERSDLLEKKLLDYAVQGKVTYVSPGPIVTMFEFEPAPGIKISKVMSLADDLSMALKASSIRISPIHGRSTLGIEVPNRDRESVYLRDIISNNAFNESNAKLTLALGKDIFGIPVMTDLAKMPHLLIAGATGSGKSVGLNTIVISLLYRATP